ncbi:hypothetical protein GRZ55_06210 [Chelativorans sp. ZYF759]|uniref:hypothetical protein n=1 Tax=Chelativorans sp. ZYF759 TaxID=2692213 RepID=UPI00145F7872|nr:hypothetical protein [Chelativorans sp. ZYF759]NMG38836.1 hypothetical protein [Chelativorans sp. ZYF759]
MVLIGMISEPDLKKSSGDSGSLFFRRIREDLMESTMPWTDATLQVYARDAAR